MSDLPSIQDGLKKLLGNRQDLAPAINTFEPASSLVDSMQFKDPTTLTQLEALRDEVVSRFPEQGMGSLLSQFVVNRNDQVRRLCQLGKEPLLSLISQGCMLPDISQGLQISYDLVKAFAEKVCTPQELQEAQEMGAEISVHSAVSSMESAYDKNDLSKAKAVFEARLKLSNGYTRRFQDRTPSNALQINNYNDNSTHMPTLMTIVGLSDDEELAPLKEHKHVGQQTKIPELPMIEDGQFELIG